MRISLQAIKKTVFTEKANGFLPISLFLRLKNVSFRALSQVKNFLKYLHF